MNYIIYDLNYYEMINLDLSYMITTSHIILFVIILVIFVWIFAKNFWRIQLYFNTTGVSFYTPTTFSISDSQNRKQFDNLVKYGMNKMKSQSVVICGLVRDVESQIPYIIQKVERVANLFQKYKILIVENDSKDNTRSLLLKWSEKNKNVIILGCGVNQKECKLNMPKTQAHEIERWRIEKMVKLRNEYISYINSNLSDYDYCIVWDLDVIGIVYLDGIANSIGWMNSNDLLTNESKIDSSEFSIDAICANGIYKFASPSWAYVYYDTYAHLDYNEKYDINNHFTHSLSKRIGCRYAFGEKLQKVKSCFSGFTIYRISSIKGLMYDMSPENNLECEHVRFNRHLSNVYVNPSMIYRLLMNK